MPSIERIKTVKSYKEFKHKEKGSVFIGQVHLINNEEMTISILESARKKYFDATHHCYAYNLFYETGKFSDDGEPSGTAGIRIGNAIKHFDLTNIIVLVIRYFGGTKLGVGPLGKAYYHTAYETLKATEISEKIRHVKIKIIFDYDMTSIIHHNLSLFDAQDIQNSFDVKPSIECCIKAELFDKFTSKITDSTKGNLEVLVVDHKVYIEK